MWKTQAAWMSPKHSNKMLWILDLRLAFQDMQTQTMPSVDAQHEARQACQCEVCLELSCIKGNSKSDMYLALGNIWKNVDELLDYSIILSPRSEVQFYAVMAVLCA